MLTLAELMLLGALLPPTGHCSSTYYHVMLNSHETDFHQNRAAGTVCESILIKALAQVQMKSGHKLGVGGECLNYYPDIMIYRRVQMRLSFLILSAIISDIYIKCHN